MAIEGALTEARIDARRYAAFASLLLLFFVHLRSTAHAASSGSWSGTVAYINRTHIGVKYRDQTRDFLIPADFDNVRSSGTPNKSSLADIKRGSFITVSFAQRALFGSTSVTKIAIGGAIGIAAPIPGNAGQTAMAPPQGSGAMITLYAHDAFNGPSIQLGLAANDLHVLSFAKKTSTFVIASGTWQLCDQPNFSGRCITVGPGRYAHGYSGNFARSIVSLEPVTASPPGPSSNR